MFIEAINLVPWLPLVVGQAVGKGGDAAYGLVAITLVPWLPLVGAIACGFCCMRPNVRWLAGPICVLSILASFVVTLVVYPNVPDDGVSVHFFDWISVGGFNAPIQYYVDGLTMLMLMVVTGIGSLIALYATGYMKGDRGYARFFAGVSLFIFAMTNLVMADNLVLLYLGWEGVGLCSYLLIGYYYEKPDAVAAANKAFIVNRIGDFGFALGILLTYLTFHTVDIPLLTQAARDFAADGATPTAGHIWIPFLLMLGAFGKSAQLPLHTWLPDAMAGPTPVSALVHAATMVTAGVYMIARLFPVFELSEWALPTVATVGGVTALFAATIALCQYDLKKVFAYSTVSQLGYMFLGVGAASTVGGVFHLFTHAFFKALLFLTAGSVMHALAGQLDLRKMSGLRKHMPLTAILMLIGCLALAGFPGLAGFFSKDTILAAAIERGTGDHAEPLYLVLGLIGLFTAFLTAFYTFRLWFRVFAGPLHFEMGSEHSHDTEAQAAAEPGHAPDHAHGHDTHGHGAHAHAPHEMPFFPMNLPLVILAIGALFAGWLGFGDDHYWIGNQIHHSTADVAHGEAGAEHTGLDVHLVMMVASSLAAILGIGVAYFFHLKNRAAADRVAKQFAGVVRLLENKYYVDELYHAAIVTPLKLFGYGLFVIDQLIIGLLVGAVAFVPRLLGFAIRPTQAGRLQGYGLGMVAGVAVALALVLFVIS